MVNVLFHLLSIKKIKNMCPVTTNIHIMLFMISQVLNSNSIIFKLEFAIKLADNLKPTYGQGSLRI